MGLWFLPTTLTYFVQLEGCSPNTPHNYKTPEGYMLNSWQRGQRQNYKKNKLTPDRIKRLEAIGFTWDILEDQFEKGFQETLLYKERTGKPNAPSPYKTTEGYRLGAWQAAKRNMYKKGHELV